MNNPSPVSQPAFHAKPVSTPMVTKVGSPIKMTGLTQPGKIKASPNQSESDAGSMKGYDPNLGMGKSRK